MFKGTCAKFEERQHGKMDDSVVLIAMVKACPMNINKYLISGENAEKELKVLEQWRFEGSFALPKYGFQGLIKLLCYLYRSSLSSTDEEIEKNFELQIVCASLAL